jgi:hypothetical protein
MGKILVVGAFIVAGAFAACKPRIYSFRATPATSSGTDSVRLDWKIRGQSSVLFSQRTIAQPPGDSIHILEFKLIAYRGKIDSFRTIQVPVIGDLSGDRVVFSVDTLVGDTVVAMGLKDTVRWRGYGISQVRGMVGRDLMVTHGGVTAFLKDTVLSDAWSGKPYGGYWKIRTVLTEAEKKDHSTIPDRLTVTVIVRSSKQ